MQENLSGLFHLSGMGENLFGQRCPDNRRSTVLVYHIGCFYHKVNDYLAMLPHFSLIGAGS